MAAKLDSAFGVTARRPFWHIGRASGIASVAALLALPLATGCSSTESGAGASLDGAKKKIGTTALDGEVYVRNRKCNDCHTPAGSKTEVMAGLTTPLPGFEPAKLYGPNLTPDPETGIGKWTDAQLRNGIRVGIDDDGERLCPQMQHYSEMKDDELTAIIAYLRALPPVKKAIPRSVCPPVKF